MKLWMSGEVQGDIERYHLIRNDVEEAVNKSLEKLGLTDAVKEWNVIPIILSKPFSAGFDEVAKRNGKVYALEFRLKLPHSEFKTCNGQQRYRLILDLLVRSVELMREMNVSEEVRFKVLLAIANARSELTGREEGADNSNA